MSFFKKTVILFLCFLIDQSLFAMNKIPKFKFNKIVNKIIPKNKSFKDISKKLSFNRPKLLFSTIKFNSSTWKMYATLGGLAAGYSLWNLNKNIASADAQLQEKKWDELNKKEKHILAEKYIENMHTLDEQSFVDASEQEKDLMIYAIIQSLLRNQDVSCLYGVYENSNEQQKNMLAQGIADSLSQGKLMNGTYVPFVYALSNDHQKNMLIAGIADLLSQGNSIHKIDVICHHSKNAHINILVPVFAKLLQEKKQVQGLSSIYRYADKNQKDILIKDIAFFIGQGHKIDIDELRSICSKSDQEQQQILAGTIADCLKLNKPIKDVEAMYSWFDIKQRDILFPTIYQYLLKGYTFNCLDKIYAYSTTQQKDILLSLIIKNIKQEKIIDPKKLRWIFTRSSEKQQALLFPIIIEFLKQGKTDLIYIYSDGNKVQKDLLFSLVIEHAKKGQWSHVLCWIYGHSGGDKKDTLFPIIIEQLKQGNPLKQLDWVYKSVNSEQRNLLFDVIVERLERGQAVENLEVIANSSTIEQYRILKKLFPSLPEKFATSLDIDMNTLSKSQTGQHLLMNFFSVFSSDVQKPQVALVIKNATNSEYEYRKKGYYVFYHAQMWHIFWLETVYSALWEIKHQQSLDNYLFPRFPHDTECFINAQNIDKEKHLRKQMMQQGNFEPNICRPQLLFLNYALFGNATNSGSSSFYYFSKNTNVKDPGITTYDIFKKFGLEAVYEKNKQHIDALEEQFLQLSEYGNMLQVALPKKHLQKHLYLTTSGGPKQTALIRMKDNSTVETDDVPELIETLIEYPYAVVDSDQKEFVWVVTADTVQKAIEDGVQIKSFNTADPEKFKQVTDELTKLLTTQLAGYWVQPEPTPWECYKKHKKK